MNHSTTKITQLNVNGKLFNNPDEVAKKVNEYFVNIGPQTEKCIPKVRNITPTKFLKNRNQYNFIIAHIEEEEMLCINLNNKSTGPCGIPIKLFFIISDIIIIPLCYLINMSLETRTNPDKLKIVKVLPIHKGRCTQDLDNFPLILLLPNFDQIIEEILHFYMFLESNNILFDQKYGFRRKTFNLLTN